MKSAQACTDIQALLRQSIKHITQPTMSQAAKVADALTRDVHYTVDEKQKSVLLTEDGYEAVEDVLQVRQRSSMLPLFGIISLFSCSSS